MNTLYINTCLNDVIICLYKNGKLEINETVYNQKYASQFIMPTIKKVLEDKNPDEIIVVNGPGAFTGVRLGVTVAKTLAYTLKIPIYTITTLEIMAISKDIVPKVISIKQNNDYYVGIFDENNNLIGDYEYLNKNSFETFSQKYNVIKDVEIDYNAIYKFIKDNKKPVNPHTVKPLYIKKISVQK